MSEVVSYNTACTTYGTYLMKQGTSGYSKFADIKDYPDLLGKRNPLEYTTLSHDQQVYKEGIRQNGELQFNCNYDHTVLASVAGLAGTDCGWAVYFGEDGADGKFIFNGTISATVSGGGVDEIRGMTLTIMPSTVITDATT